MRLGFEWTKSRVKRLEELWAEGVPTKEIGNQLGCSKHAVISKARRCYCAERESPIKRDMKAVTRQPRRARKCRTTEASLPPLPTATLPPVPPRPHAALIARGGTLPSVRAMVATAPVRRCQFPMWGETLPRPPVFCDAPVEAGPYCAEHHALCYARRVWVAEVEA